MFSIQKPPYYITPPSKMFRIDCPLDSNYLKWVLFSPYDQQLLKPPFVSSNSFNPCVFTTTRVSTIWSFLCKFNCPKTMSDLLCRDPELGITWRFSKEVNSRQPNCSSLSPEWHTDIFQIELSLYSMWGCQILRLDVWSDQLCAADLYFRKL